MRIVFQGSVAGSYRADFAELLDERHEIVELPDRPVSSGDKASYQSAEIIVSNRLEKDLTPTQRLRLFQAPTSGTELIDRSLLPKGAALCNCGGHEAAIAEYVLAALLLRHVPLAVADAALRRGEWPFHNGPPLRTELSETTIGLLGYGAIAKANITRAKAFGARVHVANRSVVQTGDLIDRYFPLTEIREFMGSADYVIVALPHLAETRGIIGERELRAMRSRGVIVNVGRGPLIAEKALYDALRENRIGGAIIDTWYSYPQGDQQVGPPSRYAFHQLSNVLMTPHMSGWTTATHRRRQLAMAANINRLACGEPLLNQLAESGYSAS